MTGGDPLKVKKLLTLNTIGDTGRSIGVQGKEVEVKMGRHIKRKKAPHVPKQIALVKDEMILNTSNRRRRKEQ